MKPEPRDITSRDKRLIRELVIEYRTIKTPSLTKRERARAIRANLRLFMAHLARARGIGTKKKGKP